MLASLRTSSSARYINAVSAAVSSRLSQPSLSMTAASSSSAHSSANHSISSVSHQRSFSSSSRQSILSSYRLLRRSIFHSFFTSSQYAEFDELANEGQLLAGETTAEFRKEQYGVEKNKEHMKFAKQRSDRWLKLLRDAYRTGRTTENPTPDELLRASRASSQLNTLLISNMNHSRYLLEGGWGIRRDTSKQIANVAHKVGLQMPKDPAPLVWIPAGAKHQKARDEILKKHDKFVKGE